MLLNQLSAKWNPSSKAFATIMCGMKGQSNQIAPKNDCLPMQAKSGTGDSTLVNPKYSIMEMQPECCMPFFQKVHGTCNGNVLNVRSSALQF